MLRRTFSAIPLAAFAAPGEESRIDPGEAGFAPDRLQRLTAWLRDLTERREYAGINVAIARKGKVAYTASFGLQDVKRTGRCGRTPSSAFSR